VFGRKLTTLWDSQTQLTAPPAFRQECQAEDCPFRDVERVVEEKIILFWTLVGYQKSSVELKCGMFRRNIPSIFCSGQTKIGIPQIP